VSCSTHTPQESSDFLSIRKSQLSPPPQPSQATGSTASLFPVNRLLFPNPWQQYKPLKHKQVQDWHRCHGRPLKVFTSPHPSPVPSSSYALISFALHFSCSPFFSLPSYSLHSSQHKSDLCSCNLVVKSWTSSTLCNPHGLPLANVQDLCDVTARLELFFPYYLSIFGNREKGYVAVHISSQPETWQINSLLMNIFKKELTQHCTGPRKPSCLFICSPASPHFSLTTSSGIGGKEGL